MKTILIRVVIVLTLLLALGAIFGAVNSTSAHAATRPASSVKPDINIAYCTGQNEIILYTTTGSKVCFANSGYTPAVVPNVYAACSYGVRGYVIGSIGGFYGLSPSSCQFMNGFPSETIESVYIN